MIGLYPSKQSFRKLAHFALFLLSISIALGVLTIWPSMAQPWTLSQLSPTPLQPNQTVSRQGNIEYTTVFFRGKPLFQVTARVDVTENPNGAETSAVILRAQTVETNLQTVFNVGFTPESLNVKVSTLDGLTVIAVSSLPKTSEKVIVTVTELDARVAQLPVSLLATDWATEIESTLLSAREEVQPAARRLQRISAMQVAGGILGSVLLLEALKRWFNRRYQLRLKRYKKLRSLDSSAEVAQSDLIDADRSERLSQRLVLKQRLTLNRGLQSLFRLGQVTVSFWGTIFILELFPETRIWGDWLLSFPRQILTIAAVMLVLSEIAQSIVRRSISRQIRDLELSDRKDARILLRAPTIQAVIANIIKGVAAITGVIWFLLWRGVNLSNMLTGAGLFGAALGIIFQSLIKDWLNGLLIFLEDQYAVGDVVEINGTVGFVEHMSVRATEIRAAGGRLTTMPHNQVGIVHNLTKDWSRIDLAVDISREANPTDAMAIMKQVITDMQKSPDWGDDILDPASLLGVSSISAAGTQIMMWIQTRRMRQWDVEREFWRRLKIAFEQQGIAMAVPQQAIRVTSTSESGEQISARQ